MANNVLRLYVDTSQKRLVQSNTSQSVAATPKFIQGDTVTLIIQLLEPNPTGGAFAPWSIISVSGLSFRVGVGQSTSATGSPTPTIFQNSWTLDTTLNTATGTLYIDPTTVATLLGSATTGTADFEIELSEGGNYTTVFHGSVTLIAELIEAGSPGTPPSGDTYMTANSSLATFVKRYGLAGEGIYLLSQDGTKRILIYAGDDGTFHADPVS